MAQIGIGCQTITWGDGQVDFMEHVAETAAAAGYRGLEIGFRRLQGVSAEVMRDLLRKSGLELIATHIGGNLEDAAQAESEKSMMDAVLEAVIALGGRYVMYSGLRYKDDAQFAADVDMLNRSARKCADRGIRLLYHNHAWEFGEAPTVMDRLLDRRRPELGFCPDVGWVAKGGVDPVAFLRRVAGDTPLVHFKDFATMAPGVDTVCLGDGVVPLAEVADWVRGEESCVEWVIAEQDKADGPADEAVTRNGRFLVKLF